MVRAKLYTVVLRRSFIFTTPSDSDRLSPPLTIITPTFAPPNFDFPFLLMTLQTLITFLSLACLIWFLFGFLTYFAVFCSFCCSVGQLLYFWLITVPQREARDAKLDFWSWFSSILCSWHYFDMILLSNTSYIWIIVFPPWEIVVKLTYLHVTCNLSCVPLYAVSALICLGRASLCLTDMWAKPTWRAPPSGWERVWGPQCSQCWALPCTECCSKPGDAQATCVQMFLHSRYIQYRALLTSPNIRLFLLHLLKPILVFVVSWVLIKKRFFLCMGMNMKS